LAGEIREWGAGVLGVVRRGVGYRFGSGGERRKGGGRHGRRGKGEWIDGRAGRDEGWWERGEEGVVRLYLEGLRQ
jgi:hypothetical protein